MFLNQQIKEFASKQNFNNLMIKIYFLHTSQEPIRKLWTNFVSRDVISISCTNETRLIDQSELAYYLNYFIIYKSNVKHHLPFLPKEPQIILLVCPPNKSNARFAFPFLYSFLNCIFCVWHFLWKLINEPTVIFGNN
jgi:hypothetical protein